MSTDYADWTPDELRAEIAALVISVERLERDRDGLRQEWHKVNDARRRNAIENTRLRSEIQRLRSAAKYLRACAHLFPHVNTDRATCTEIGLPDEGDVWCLGCTIGATLDYFDRELLAGDDEAEWNRRARQWVNDYEAESAKAFADD